MDHHMKELLMKVIQKKKDKPEIMRGYDISSDEISYILETGRIPLDILSCVAGDIFFFMEYEELGTSEEDAKKIRHYLISKAKKEFKELKKMFPYVELKMKEGLN